MKPKKAQKILKKLDVYLSMLEIKQPFLTPLTFQQRLDFREYAKSLLIKEKKKEQPTFTQPKEVGEKAIYNSFPRIERVRKKGIDFTLYYYSNNKVDVSFSKKENCCNCINIDSGFVVNSVDVLQVNKEKGIDWVQIGNKLIFIH